MQSLFPGYYAPTEAQLKTLWSRGAIVLDANVLLNLYRYPDTARIELLELLRSVQDRLWVPYHAALEFHRNRLSVIADQKRRFHEVKELAQKTRATFSGEINKLKLSERHALINPNNVVAQVNSAIDSFVKEIDELELKHLDVNKSDSTLSSLIQILADRVGAAPDQSYIEKIKKDASERYPAKMPPGYMDADKSKSVDPSFYYAGVRYDRQLGDLIVWNQILDFARDNKTSHIMFVTDDDKEDWWHIVTSSGSKTIGPRPELVEEARRVASVELFHMFKSSSFMVQAKVFLKSKVSENTIEQVEALAQTARRRDIVSLTDSETALNEWLLEQHPGWTMEETFLPDFTLRSPNKKETVGVEIIRATKDAPLHSLYKGRVSLLSEMPDDENYQRSDIIIVVPDNATAKKEAINLSETVCEPGFGIILGHLDYSSGQARFVPSLRLNS